jgi:hypothetical protein
MKTRMMFTFLTKDCPLFTRALAAALNSLNGSATKEDK